MRCEVLLFVNMLLCKIKHVKTSMKLFAARQEDAHQGWVWLQNADLPARSVVKIKNLENQKAIYCETLQIDANFLAQYNVPPRKRIDRPSEALVISDWYRIKLGGLQTQVEVSLEIVPRNFWFGPFIACIEHPQLAVRLASWLGGIGLVLGVIGFILGIISVWPNKV
jgi:hypothetical protein